MPSSRDDIAQRFERFADAELIDLLCSGELTELAQEVAIAELSRRGVDCLPPNCWRPRSHRGRSLRRHQSLI
jgi:hypothetical protein